MNRTDGHGAEHDRTGGQARMTKGATTVDEDGPVVQADPGRADAEAPPFLNRPIDVDGLPRLEDDGFDSLHPNFLRLRLIGDAIFAAVVVVAAGVLSFLVAWWWLPLVIGLVLVLLTALAAWLQRLEVAHIGYLVREQDFSFRRGVISRNVTTVPFGRIQHVSIDRGPLARYFGLATLEMQTAGDGLTVPGIGNETAQRLKALVVDRAGAAADDELSDGS